MMNWALLMKRSFYFPRLHIPDNNVSFFSSNKESFPVGAFPQCVVLITVSIDPMLADKLKFILAIR
jgi:hypothetical protein